MRLRKTLLILVLIVLGVWGIEAIWLIHRNGLRPTEIKIRAEAQRRTLRAQYRDRERKLNNEYGEKKYIATGKTVYDRIFNTPEQTIVELIQRIAAESLPGGWKCEVRVDEFTHFVLLVYLPHNSIRVAAADVMSYLVPVVRYCDFCLSDVAVFDRTRKSYLFYDSDTLKCIARGERLTDTLLAKVGEQGEAFTQFNSTTIKCEKYEQHLLLPVEIAGPDGVETCLALFDTGASVTTVSHNIVTQTGSDNLAISPTRTFNTANGWMSCPIVYREVDIGGFPKRIEVAVNQMDSVSLLGMNYFEGLKYIVDSQNACIYVWKERPIEIPKIEYTPQKNDGAVKASEGASRRDLSPLVNLADEWLDVAADTNEAREQ